jgi:hypothetical protein
MPVQIMATIVEACNTTFGYLVKTEQQPIFFT